MKYTKEEAIAKAIKRNREVSSIVYYIMKWDTELDSILLARSFKKSRIWVYKMSVKYGLDYAKNRGKKTMNQTLIKRRITGQLRKEGYSLKEIAKIFNCRWQYVQQLSIFDN